jgi:hypothetical protein
MRKLIYKCEITYTQSVLNADLNTIIVNGRVVRDNYYELRSQVGDSEITSALPVVVGNYSSAVETPGDCKKG